MAFGKIPRFSPSFSPQEAFLAVRYLLQGGPNDEVVRKFERQFADYIGVKYSVMVPSARYGFYLLLKAFGVEKNDEVLVPGLTYFAIPAMVPLLGARPTFADIGLNSHVLDPEAFKAAITPRTKVVVPRHLFGTPCDMEAINQIAQENGIKVIEDCAQSTGARFKGRRVGGWGDAAYYTFGLTKNITTLSGAMITTNDEKVASFVRSQIDQSGYPDKKRAIKETVTGMAMYVATHPLVYWATVHPAVVWGNKMGKDPIHERFGEAECVYSTLPESYQQYGKALAVQAAVGMKQLERIERLNGARRKNGQALDLGLKGLKSLELPTYPDGSEPIYMSYVIHHEDREQFASKLRERGVDTTTGYMNDMSDHPLFQEYRMPCPNAAKANKQLLHLPVHPNLSVVDRQHLIESVRETAIILS